MSVSLLPAGTGYEKLSIRTHVVLVPKPPTPVYFVQVRSPFGFTFRHPIGGNVPEKSCVTGATVGVFTITATGFGLVVQPLFETLQA